MDPLAAADTIINHAQRIFELVKAARTNTEECKAVHSRVERLLDVAQRIRRHPDPLLEKQVCNVEGVMERAKEVVEKYSKMKRGVWRAVQVLKAVHIQHQFESINASLDSVLQGVWCTWREEGEPLLWLCCLRIFSQLRDGLSAASYCACITHFCGF